MRRNLSSDDREDVEINLSPMIDMVFILLIFFIVTTVFVEE
ncbi:MAG: ExbD/TolR family protein, partial [Coraliomargarita sp.]